MRKSNLERLREAKTQRRDPITINDPDGFLRILLGGPPNPTQRALVYDDAEEIAYMGMVGAAKTSAICALGWMLCLYEPGFKLLVARHHSNDLKDTTGKRMEEMLHRLPPGTLLDRNKQEPMKWWIKAIGDSDEVSEITFMGLTERPSSYEFHGAIIDEADEVPEDIFNEIRTRCRLKGKTRKIAIAFNPTGEDHWIYTECTGRNERQEVVREPGLKLLVPTPGENSHNLVDGYYDNLRKRLPPDMVQRLIEGQWGSSIKGKPVFGRDFKREFHVKRFHSLEHKLPNYEPTRALFRFWDFGYRHPVVQWAQLTPEGHLRILREEMQRDMEIHEFAPRVALITSREFPYCREIYDYGDPAVKQRKDTGSTLAVLMKHGIQMRYVTSGIDEGIRAVRMLLGRVISGQAAFQIDSRCFVTIRALESGYCYPGDGEPGDPAKPKKDGFYDHPMDSLRYGIVNLFGPVRDTAYHLSGKDFGNIPDNVSYQPGFDPLNGFGNG